MWEEHSEDRWMFTIFSNSPVEKKADGTFAAIDDLFDYQTQRLVGLDKVSAPEREVFGKIEEVFKEGVGRDQISGCWNLSALLKEALMQMYFKKQ